MISIFIRVGADPTDKYEKAAISFIKAIGTGYIVLPQVHCQSRIIPIFVFQRHDLIIYPVTHLISCVKWYVTTGFQGKDGVPIDGTRVLWRYRKACFLSGQGWRVVRNDQQHLHSSRKSRQVLFAHHLRQGKCISLQWTSKLNFSHFAFWHVPALK